MRLLVFICFVLTTSAEVAAQRIGGPTPVGANSQVSRTLEELPENLIFYEGFDNAAIPSLPNDWTTFSFSSTAFVTGTAGDATGQANANGFWPVPLHGIFAMSNDDVCNCNKSKDLLTSRSFDFTGKTSLRIGFSCFQNGANAQTAELQVKSNSTIWQTLFVIPASSQWENHDITVPAAMLESGFQFRFQFSDNGLYASGLALDDIYLSSKVKRSIDLDTFYTVDGSVPASGYIADLIPITQAQFADWQFGANVKNTEQSSENVKLSVSISGPIPYAETSSPWRISSNHSEHIKTSSSSTYSPTNLGKYQLNAHLLSGTQDSISNVTERSFIVSDSVYTRLNQPTDGIGIWLGENTDRTGSVFHIYNEDEIQSVLVGIHPASLPGARFRIKIFDFNVLTANLYFSDVIEIDEDHIGKSIRVPIDKSLAPGKYICAVEKEFGRLILSSNSKFNSPEGVSFYRTQTAGWRHLSYYPSISLVFPPKDPICSGYISATMHSESCAGALDGQIEAELKGHAGSAVSYTWSTGANNATINGLDSGTYSVTATAGTCEYKRKLTLTKTDSLSIVPTITHDACNTGSGQITLNIEGGMAPYAVLFDGNATDQTISFLDSGAYSLQITDVNLCAIDTFLTLLGGGSIDLSIVLDTPNCNTANGGIEVTPFASYPITYDWSNGQDTNVISLLNSGYYSLTVTDSIGCQKDTLIALIDSGAASVSLISAVDISCPAESTGQLNVTAIGGTAPISYFWSNGLSGSEIIGLSQGNYYLTATDAIGCRSLASYVLTNVNPPLFLDFIEQGIDCFGGATGSITALASGGSPNYTHAWSSGPSSITITQLSSGLYALTVTDSAGCTASKSTSISTRPQFFVRVDSIFGDTNGVSQKDAAIYLSTFGGTQPYIYHWSNGYKYEDLVNVDTGLYSVTITDQFGCNLNYSKYLSNDPLLISDIRTTHSWLKLYPNPARKGELFHLTSGTALARCEVYDINGTLVSSMKLENKTSHEIVTNLSTGVYLIRVLTMDNQEQTLRLIIGQ